MTVPLRNDPQSEVLRRFHDWVIDRMPAHGSRHEAYVDWLRRQAMLARDGDRGKGLWRAAGKHGYAEDRDRLYALWREKVR